MMLRKKTKEHPIKGCAISLLTLVGLLFACFLFCTVLFQLNQNNDGAATGALLSLFG